MSSPSTGTGAGAGSQIPLPQVPVSSGAHYTTQPDLTPLAAYGATMAPTPTSATPAMLAPPNNKSRGRGRSSNNHSNNNNNTKHDAAPDDPAADLDADADDDLDAESIDVDPTSTATSTSTPTPSAPREYPQSAYNYGTWTAEDDRALVAARSRGQHWADLQRTYFPTKTANACRKRYERLMERKGVYDYDARKFERIAKEYMGMRKQIWSGLAARVGEKWPVVEAQCMSTGLRTIQSNARSYTNRWRREAKISQKARSVEAGGTAGPHPGSGLGPVTNMGLISPVEDEFGGNFLAGSDEMGTPTSESMNPMAARTQNPGMMPPPPPYMQVGGLAGAPVAQHDMGYNEYPNGRPSNMGIGRPQALSLMPQPNQPPGPVGAQWQSPGLQGGYIGHQERQEW
jgi:hypothetical protein